MSSGLSQRQVATELGLKVRQTVGKWESGEGMPRLDEWYNLGQLYGVSLDYLVYGIRTVPVSKCGMVSVVLARPGVNPQGAGFTAPAG
jgi:Predicted transcriptional regulators